MYGSLTEPKHVATIDATLKSVVLDRIVVQFIVTFEALYFGMSVVNICLTTVT
jgi:hypothetical protein